MALEFKIDIRCFTHEERILLHDKRIALIDERIILQGKINQVEREISIIDQSLISDELKKMRLKERS